MLIHCILTKELPTIDFRTRNCFFWNRLTHLLTKKHDFAHNSSEYLTNSNKHVSLYLNADFVFSEFYLQFRQRYFYFYAIPYYSKNVQAHVYGCLRLVPSYLLMSEMISSFKFVFIVKNKFYIRLCEKSTFTFYWCSNQFFNLILKVPWARKDRYIGNLVRIGVLNKWRHRLRGGEGSMILWRLY